MDKPSGCPHCGIPGRDQHSLREAGICDGLRTGKLRKVPTADEHVPTHKQVERTEK